MDKQQNYTAKTLQGLEQVLAQELLALGATDVKPGRRVVTFSGNKELLYRANLNVRTAINILVPVANFGFHTEPAFFKALSQIKWNRFLQLEQTFAIRSTVFSDVFNHTRFPALRMKDAIADWFRSEYGRRPSVNVEKTDIQFDLHIADGTATISLDSSGDNLNKRGYRIDGWKAPLNEVLAAGMIQLTEWDTKSEFHNPMCGSGTLAIEAAMLAANIPANYRRLAFGFHNWPNFDDALWKRVYSESVDAIKKPAERLIYANDISRGALRIAQQNATAAGVANMIQFEGGDFTQLRPATNSGIVVLNPPYGERLKEADLENLYKSIGDHLKQNYQGFDAWIQSGNMDALKRIGLKSSRKITIFNGKIETRFVKFGLYKGSKKNKPSE